MSNCQFKNAKNSSLPLSTIFYTKRYKFRKLDFSKQDANKIDFYQQFKEVLDSNMTFKSYLVKKEFIKIEIKPNGREFIKFKPFRMRFEEGLETTSPECLASIKEIRIKKANPSEINFVKKFFIEDESRVFDCRDDKTKELFLNCAFLYWLFYHLSQNTIQVENMNFAQCDLFEH